MGTFGRVHDQRDFTVFHHVDDVRAAFIDLVHHLTGDAIFAEEGTGAACCDDAEPKVGEDAHGLDHDLGFIRVLDRDEHLTLGRQDHTRAQLCLEEGAFKGGVAAHDLTGRAHFRPKDRVHAREAGEGQNGLFHGERVDIGIDQIKRGQFLTGHDARGDRRDRRVHRLGHKGHGARGTRVHLNQVDLTVFDCELDVHQADHVQTLGQGHALTFYFGDQIIRQRVGRQRTGTVARVDAGLFDVLHDARDMDVIAVTQGVNVKLGRAGQIAVEQNGAIAGNHNGLFDVAFQTGHIAHDFHRATAQNIGRTDHQRKADLARDLQRLGVGMGDAVLGLFQVQTVDQILEPLTVFGKVDGVGAGAEDRDTFGLKRVGQFQRGLTAELNDHAFQGAVFLFHAQDFHHVFERQRLEIQTVRGVIVGRHGLGVTVDHDGLIPRLGQRETGVTAAIVELDALTDTVGAAAKDDDLVLVAGARLALDLIQHGGLIGRVHVGRLRLELGGAGVDTFEHRSNAKVVTRAAHLILVAARQFRQTRVAKAQHFQLTQAGLGDGQAVLAHAFFGLDDLADTVKEPRIKRGCGLDFVVGQTVAHGLCNGAHPVGRRGRDGGDHGGLVGRAVDFDLVKAGQAGFHRRQRLLQRLVDGATDGHGLAHGFHRRGQFGLRAREFLEGKARDLGDDIVDGRLERGGRDLGDVVVQLVQRIANRQFRRDFRNRETGRLGCQRGRTRHARVHFDDDHTAIGGVHGPLHVRAAGFHADLAQHVDRVRAHDLVFFVRQGQSGGHGDRVARVHTHRVHVFDRTDDDGVVGGVAHHLHLVFFPTQQGFIDQDLVHRRGIKARAAIVFVIVAVIGHAAAGPAKGKCGADNRGQADVFEGGHAFFDGVGDGRFGVFDAQTIHGLTEQFAVFGHFDGLALGADQFDVELLQHTHVGQRQGGVQTRLATHGRQQGVGALFLDDLGDDFGGDRLNIGRIGQTGVGHDRRGVRVHQNDAVAFFAQRLTGLCTGIVELTRLPDDNRARADDHDGTDIGSFRHGSTPELANSWGLYPCKVDAQDKFRRKWSLIWRSGEFAGGKWR